MFGREFNARVVRVDNGEKLSERFQAVGPDKKYVIEISLVYERLEGDLVENFSFPLCHENVGV